MTTGRSTALHGAAARWDDEARRLIDEGADPNALDEKGRSPLHYAARYNLANTRLLLEAGADPNAADPGGIRPIHFAAVGGGICIPALLEKGALIDPPDKNGHTPLHHAASANSSEGVSCLLAHGADPRIPDLTGETALDMNGVLGTGATDEMWLADAQLHGPDRLAEHLERLLEEGATHRIFMVLAPEKETGRFSAVAHRGKLPVGDWKELGERLSAYCRERGLWGGLKTLGEAGLPVSLPEALRAPSDGEGFCDAPPGEEPAALIAAALSYRPRAIAALLSLSRPACDPAIDAALFATLRPPPPTTDPERLARAARDMAEVVHLLLAAGARIEATEGEAATRAAKSLGLLNASGDALAQDSGHGISKRYFAVPGFLDGLLKTPHDTPLLSAVISQSPAVAELLAAGADRSVTRIDGRRAIHVAAAATTGWRPVGTVQALLDAGVPVDEPDQHGWRPLIAATHDGIIDLLLDRGASPILTDEETKRLGPSAAAKLTKRIEARSPGAGRAR